MTESLAHRRELLRRVTERLRTRGRTCRVPTLFLMTADERNVDWIEVLKSLPRGAGVVIRARSDYKRKRLAEDIVRAAKPRGILTLIAGDAKLAIRLRADGVHIPEAGAQLSLGLRRAMCRFLVTTSAHGRPGMVKAMRFRADAVLLSPMFRTQSHPSGKQLGPSRWGLLRSGSSIPVIALGGVNAFNAMRAISAGANGLSLIGGWVDED